MRTLFLTVGILFCGHISAEDFMYNGIRYYILSEQEVEVMKPAEGTYSGEITIPSCVIYNKQYYRVVGIGDQAFQGATATNIVLPAGSIRYIGERAFNDCTMTSFTIPASVGEIGDYAFFYCDKLKNLYFSVDFPNSIAIGKGAFEGILNGGNTCTLYAPTDYSGAYSTNTYFMSKFSAFDEWAAPKIYPLVVAGVLVTEENKDDILGESTVHYTPGEDKLTFNNSNIIAGPNLACILSTSTDMLFITGDATLQSTAGNVLYAESDVSFAGANITFYSNGYGLEVTGGYVYFNNSNINGHSIETKPVITGFSDFFIESGNFCVAPLYYYMTSDGMKNADGEFVTELIIQTGEPQSYDLTVFDIPVTDNNRTDIAGTLEAYYEPSTKTLTLKKNFSAAEHAIVSGIDGLTILLADGVEFQTANDAIVLNESATITSVDGNTYGLALYPNGFTGIRAEKDLTFKNIYLGIDNCENCIVGSENSNILFDNCEASCVLLPISEGLPIYNFKTFTLSNCYFSHPQGLHFESDGKLYDIDGNLATGFNIKRGKEKVYPDISWSRDTYIASLQQAFTSPALKNPGSLNVTYQTSNPDVATVDDTTGEVTIKKKGTTTITAFFAGNDDTYAGKVSYTLVVSAMNGAKYDVNGDGSVTAQDASLILQYVAGKITE